MNVFKRYNESAEGTSSLHPQCLSSVQAFMGVNHAVTFGKRLHIRCFQCCEDEVMIDGGGWNPCARSASFHYQEFGQAVALMEGDQILV